MLSRLLSYIQSIVYFSKSNVGMSLYINALFPGMNWTTGTIYFNPTKTRECCGAFLP